MNAPCLARCTYPLLVAAPLLLIGCGDSVPDDTQTGDNHPQVHEEVVIIDSKPAALFGAFFTESGLTLTFEDGQRMSFHNIQDFTLQWGISTTARVEVREEADPEDDGSSLSMRLLEILDTQEDAVGTQYQYPLVVLDSPAIMQTHPDYADDYLFLGQHIRCAQDVNCAQLVDMSNDGGVVSIDFEYIGSDTDHAAAVTLTHWQ
jgi:hypothetical protein